MKHSLFNVWKIYLPKNMHNIDIDFDLSVEEIAKIEGAASLTLAVRKGKITQLAFSINEWKRFYTQAIQGKPLVAVPQLVARICGTCSNAHLLASVQTVEQALNIIPSEQTQLLRKLLMYGLMIRDHALHLYIFSLPDLFGKNSILDFDENNVEQHTLLEDAFAVKDAGNQLSIVTGGRSVHAPFVTVGGFQKLPELNQLKKVKEKLNTIRPKILTLLSVFSRCKKVTETPKNTIYAGLVSSDNSFLTGPLKTSDGEVHQPAHFLSYLASVVIPYSHARGFTFQGKPLLVGALARLNLSKNTLHPQTRRDTALWLERFPSLNFYDNNIAQAIEILHAIDASITLIDSLQEIKLETLPKIVPQKTESAGAIEAPRGTLYYKLQVNESGVVEHGDIIVPTGQNQVLMEKAIGELVQNLIDTNTPKEAIPAQIEELIRTFDPCMSCASHFLKVKWLQ